MKFVPVVFSLALATCAHAQDAAGKVGIINIQEAMIGTKDGKQTTMELDKKFLPEQKEFETRQTEISQLEEKFAKGATTMPADQRTQLANDIEEKKKRLDRDMQDAETDMKSQQQQVLKSMASRMMAVISKYSKEHGFTIILDSGNQDIPVLFVADGVDITNDIVALYDKGPQ
jgi:outer membrane protein